MRVPFKYALFCTGTYVTSTLEDLRVSHALDCQCRRRQQTKNSSPPAGWLAGLPAGRFEKFMMFEMSSHHSLVCLLVEKQNYRDVIHIIVATMSSATTTNMASSPFLLSQSTPDTSRPEGSSSSSTSTLETLLIHNLEFLGEQVILNSSSSTMTEARTSTTTCSTKPTTGTLNLAPPPLKPPCCDGECRHHEERLESWKVFEKLYQLLPSHRENTKDDAVRRKLQNLRLVTQTLRTTILAGDKDHDKSGCHCTRRNRSKARRSGTDHHNDDTTLTTNEDKTENGVTPLAEWTPEDWTTLQERVQHIRDTLLLPDNHTEETDATTASTTTATLRWSRNHITKQATSRSDLPTVAAKVPSSSTLLDNEKFSLLLRFIQLQKTISPVRRAIAQQKEQQLLVGESITSDDDMLRDPKVIRNYWDCYTKETDIIVQKSIGLLLDRDPSSAAGESSSHNPTARKKKRPPPLPSSSPPPSLRLLPLSELRDYLENVRPFSISSLLYRLERTLGLWWYDRYPQRPILHSVVFQTTATENTRTTTTTLDKGSSDISSNKQLAGTITAQDHPSLKGNVEDLESGRPLLTTAAATTTTTTRRTGVPILQQHHQNQLKKMENQKRRYRMENEDEKKEDCKPKHKKRKMSSEPMPVPREDDYEKNDVESETMPSPQGHPFRRGPSSQDTTKQMIKVGKDHDNVDTNSNFNQINFRDPMTHPTQKRPRPPRSDNGDDEEEAGNTSNNQYPPPDNLAKHPYKGSASHKSMSRSGDCVNRNGEGLRRFRPGWSMGLYEKKKTATTLFFDDSDEEEDNDDENKGTPAGARRKATTTTQQGRQRQQQFRQRRKRWTREEKQALQEGLVICGHGKWAQIKGKYPTILGNRSNVQIKDCYRTMLANGEIGPLPSESK